MAMLHDLIAAWPIVIVACICIPAVAVSAFEWAVFWCIRRVKEVIDAEILSLAPVKGRRVGYLLTFRYGVESCTYETRRHVSRETYKRLQEQQSVPIRYIVNRPYIARLAKQNNDYFDRNVITIAAIGVSMLFPLLIVVWPVCFVASILYLYTNVKLPKFLVQVLSNNALIEVSVEDDPAS
jgi:hypothetical protein